MPKQEDAHLILRLYELRREDRVREARAWFCNEFLPQSIEDLQAVLGRDKSPLLRVVMFYWDMACALVHHGAIDPELFNETNGEHIVAWAKLEPFVEQLRAMYSPGLLFNLEKVKSTPTADDTVARWQEAAAMRASA